MSNVSDLIRGAIKLDGFREGQCFTSIDDYTKALPGMLAVEIPASITNVTVSADQPTDDERDNLWFRRDNSGSFLGLYLYAQGAWQQIYPVPQQIFKLYGDSRNIPKGFALADQPFVSLAQLSKLKEEWLVGGSSPTWYSIFDVVYVGF